MWGGMDTGLYFSVQIGELDKTTFDVVDFSLEEALSTLSTLTLTLSSVNADIDLQGLLLQRASLTVYIDGQKQRTVNGIVEGATRGDTGFKRSFYTFTIRPEMWQLTLSKDSRIYHFMSVPEILDAILKDHHIAFDQQLQDPHLQREYVTMKRETPFEFFCRLAAEEGIFFWFEEDKLFYSDSHLGMSAGPELIYNPHPQSATKEYCINRLQFGTFMRPVEASLKDYKYSHPDVAMDAQSKSQKPLPRYSVYDSYGRYDSETVARQFSRYRLEALQADSEQGQASSNCFKLSPGLIFKLSEHPAAAMNGRWQVVRIVHRGTLSQALGDESDGGAATLNNQLTFIPGKNDWRAPFIHKPQADGAEIATVTGPAGEEIYVNEDGAVKVHFHWNRYDAPDENASCWVRVVQNWNGDGFGFLSTPRIGQEVIVDYLNSDIDRPIIIGTTYNGNNRPPVKLPESKTQMSIRSKTHKGEGFNEMRFEDEAGKEEIYFHAQRDYRSEVIHDQLIEIGHDRTKSVAQDQQESIGRDKRTTVGQDHFETISRNSVIKVVNDQEIQIDNNQTVIVNSSRQAKIFADDSLTTGGNQRLEVEGTYDEIVKTKIFSRTKNYILHAEDKMTIAGPGGSITIDGSGMTLKATSLKIIAQDLAIKGGDSDQITALKSAVQEGKPFCEVCAKAKEAAEK